MLSWPDYSDGGSCDDLYAKGVIITCGDSDRCVAKDVLQEELSAVGGIGVSAEDLRYFAE